MGTDYKEIQSVRNQRGNIKREKLEMYRDKYKTTLLKTEVALQISGRECISQ